jgi:hypothetical protein
MVCDGFWIDQETEIPCINESINPSIVKEKVIAFIAVDLARCLSHREDVFLTFNDIEQCLRLPLFDGSMPLTVFNPETGINYHGICGINHAGLLLECAMKRRDYINRLPDRERDETCQEPTKAGMTSST